MDKLKHKKGGRCKRLLKRFVSGWKSVNHNKYTGYWIDRGNPLTVVRIIILRHFDKEKMKWLHDWLEGYIREESH